MLLVFAKNVCHTKKKEINTQFKYQSEWSAETTFSHNIKDKLIFILDAMIEHERNHQHTESNRNETLYTHEDFEAINLLNNRSLGV